MSLIAPGRQRVATGERPGAPFERPAALSDVVAWCAAAGLGLAGLGAALLSTSPKGPAVAAVFPPWWSPARSFAAAAEAGDVARTGAVRSVIVVRSDRAGLADRLRAAGALLILSASGPLGCRSDASPETKP